MIPESARTLPPLPLGWAVIVAAASGPILDAGFPDLGIWPLTFLGIGLVLLTLVGRRVGGAILVSLVAGLSFYLTHISWASLFLGLLPMTALSVLESLFFALGAVAITLAYRWLPGVWPTAAGRLLLLPAVVAGLWTAREAWASVWPYGGFAWGRMSLSQSESPISSLFPWLGASGVTFAMVFFVAAVLAAVIELFARRNRTAASLLLGIRPSVLRIVVAPVAILTVMVALPAWPVVTDGSIRVAAVQGNGAAGYFQGSTSDELIQAQANATMPLFGQDVDVVLWPEGTTFRDPTTDQYTGKVFDYITREMDAPLVAQGVTQRGDKLFNTAVLWKNGEGVVDYFDKRHPVPFGEYIPDRAFWRPFAPDLIDLIQRDYTPGTTDLTFDINGIITGITICFDIVDDQVLYDSVREGAQVLFSSSNNADFGRTDESVQQLAIARIRAMELGRSLVNVSTVGITAVIAPDGSVTAELPWFTEGSLVEDVPLSTTVTPALVVGRQIEWSVSILSLAALIMAGFVGRSRRHKRD
ncbi:MAG: apolipoprotein N-acyltransferase [Rhodoglobus sp.]